MYTVPLRPGQEPARLETIVAVDLLGFDGQKPMSSTWNRWDISPGPHKVNAQVNYAGRLSSTSKEVVFPFKPGHAYVLGFRAYNMQSTGAGSQSGDFELALYDRSAECVHVESRAGCFPKSRMPWAGGWGWSVE